MRILLAVSALLGAGLLAVTACGSAGNGAGPTGGRAVPSGSFAAVFRVFGLVSVRRISS